MPGQTAQAGLQFLLSQGVQNHINSCVQTQISTWYFTCNNFLHKWDFSLSNLSSLYEVLTFALRVLQDMLLKRGISWISEWFCTELWESLLQVGPLLFGTCQIPGVRTGYFLWGLFFLVVVLACHCMLVMKTLTHSSEDSAVHAECNCNSSLAHSSRARVDEHTLTRPQTPTHHHGVISCSIDHRYRGSLLQSPTHTESYTTLMVWSSRIFLSIFTKLFLQWASALPAGRDIPKEAFVCIHTSGQTFSRQETHHAMPIRVPAWEFHSQHALLECYVSCTKTVKSTECWTCQVTLLNKRNTFKKCR